MSRGSDEARQQRAADALASAREFGEFNLAEVCKLAIQKFDHKKYAGASTLTICDWDALLRARSNYWHRSDALESWELSNGFRVMFVVDLMDDPLRVRLSADSSPYDPTVTDMMLASAWSARKTIGRLADAKRVCELWDAHMNTPGEAIDWASGQDMAESLARMAAEDAAKEKEFNAVFGSYSGVLESAGIYAGGQFVQVDTSAPDSVILEHFKEWLAHFRSNERERNPRSLSITDADLRKWAQNRVLAYLDLTLLCKWSGARLPVHMLGNKIFPDISDVDISEKVRKTTAPMAQSLIDDDMLEAIHLLANAERLRNVE